MGSSIRNTYIWLNSLGVSSKTTNNIEQEIGNIKNIWDLSNSEIMNLVSIRKSTKDKILTNRNDDYLDKINRILDNERLKILTIDDDTYPKRLLNIYDPPKVLYYVGKDIVEETSIAVVGSRKMTSYGRWATEKIVKELSNIGVTIVSGLALGIDSIAHKTALENKGKTIGVIGNGLDQIYPKRNQDLYRQIPEEGTIISEYFFGTEPLPHNFPHRNRIISGISSGVLVIEAKKQSGSLITGHHALEQGKEVFALPGNINSIFSEGTNLLIQDGAKLVLDTDDIIEEIEEIKKLKNESKVKSFDEVDLSELELLILNEIKNKPISCDEIVMRTRKDVSTVSGVLTILEIKGLVKEMTGRIFTLS